MEFLIFGNDIAHDLSKQMDDDGLRLAGCSNGAGCANGLANIVDMEA